VRRTRGGTTKTTLPRAVAQPIVRYPVDFRGSTDVGGWKMEDSGLEKGWTCWGMGRLAFLRGKNCRKASSLRRPLDKGPWDQGSSKAYEAVAELIYRTSQIVHKQCTAADTELANKCFNRRSLNSAPKLKRKRLTTFNNHSPRQ